jgi:O-antigen/teichoic acid export membrane protein
MANAAPGVNELVAKKEWRNLSTVYYRLLRYAMFLSVPFSLGVLVFHRALITRWAGASQYGGPGFTVVGAVFGSWVVFSNVYCQFLFAFGHVRYLSAINLAEGCLKILLSLVFVRRLGLLGIPAGTLAASLLVGIPSLPFTLRFLAILPQRLFKDALIPVMLNSLAVSVAAGIVRLLFRGAGYLSLFLWGGGFLCACAAITWCVGLTISERHSLRMAVHRRFA